jgi:transcription-repair coupling factor (superfamily II helicase)
LVVIDEEQRFGVTHKEHLKKLRTEVDVLTLTATPIPRTLYMALTGVRDISNLNTPPEERLPIITHVGRILRVWCGKPFCANWSAADRFSSSTTASTPLTR